MISKNFRNTAEFLINNSKFSVPRAITASVRHSEMPSSSSTTNSAAQTPSTSVTHSTTEKHHHHQHHQHQEPTSVPTPSSRNMQSCGVESTQQPDRKQVSIQYSEEEGSEYFTDELDDVDDEIDDAAAAARAAENIRIPACLLQTAAQKSEEEDEYDVRHSLGYPFFFGWPEKNYLLCSDIC